MLEHRSNLKPTRSSPGGELGSNVEKTDIVKDKRIAELELQKIKEFLPLDAMIYSQRDIIEGQINKEFSEKKLVYADARLQLKGKVYTLDEAILLLERQQANTKIDQIGRASASLKLISPASGIVAYNNPGSSSAAFRSARTHRLDRPIAQPGQPRQDGGQMLRLEGGRLKTDQPGGHARPLPWPGVHRQGQNHR